MSDAADLLPLWHLDHDRAVFAGPLARNAIHRHSTAVYLAGLYGPFGLRIDGAEWLCCRTAMIPAGVAYEFDMGGEPLAVLYPEAGVAGADHLARLVRKTHAVGRALVGSDGEISLLREMYEDRDSSTWIARGLDDFLGFASGAGPQMDLRMLRVIETLRENYGDVRRVQLAAASVGLSPSRFQHVFTKGVGVPFRRYRAWCRMRAAIRAVVNGSNLTAAAHEAGYADQAHFAREFRRTFGASATPTLSRVRGGAPKQ